jgi:hypothetical protein
MTVWRHTTRTRFRGHGQLTVACTLPGLLLAAIFLPLWIARRREK